MIDRLAELACRRRRPRGRPGLGVLTRFLADRVAHVHAVEVDRSLEPRLREAVAERPNVDLVFGDALQLDLAALDPAPGKLVANLPYNVATPLVVESLDGLPSLEQWCVMVQREVADRFFAEPRTKAYGAVSVLLQLATERTGFHPVAADGVPTAAERRLGARRLSPAGAPAEYPELKRLVEAAFAHRRKTLPNSLGLAGLASRAEAADALGHIGRPASTRAEELAPDEYPPLLAALR